MTQSSVSFMDRALELARGVLGTTSPNPAVGCVVVKDGVIIGEGATQPAGGPHAEPPALAQAGAGAKGANLFVTLEPHSYHGRTPPCTDAIIQARISEVHMAMIDPNPLVAGQGRRLLEAAGIRTFLGERGPEAAKLNEGFIKWVTRGRPFVTVKYAASLDGKIAASTGDSRWITGEASRAYVHRLRAVTDAIMVGANTAQMDDPQLTARDAGVAAKRQPLRVVVDSSARLPPAARMLREPGHTLVAVTEAAPRERRLTLEASGAEIAILPSSGASVDLSALMKHLATRDITNVIVEGGGVLIGSLFAGGLVDKVLAFFAPVIIGGTNSPTPVEGWAVQQMDQALRLRDVSIQQFGDDVLVVGYTGV